MFQIIFFVFVIDKKDLLDAHLEKNFQRITREIFDHLSHVNQIEWSEVTQSMCYYTPLPIGSQNV